MIDNDAVRNAYLEQEILDVGKIHSDNNLADFLAKLEVLDALPRT